jgi:uncharacterized protein YhjY with autotransporter beta-barrel domain
MSYAELKNGKLTLFNDTIWTALNGSAGYQLNDQLGIASMSTTRN